VLVVVLHLRMTTAAEQDEVGRDVVGSVAVAMVNVKHGRVVYPWCLTLTDRLSEVLARTAEGWRVVLLTRGQSRVAPGRMSRPGLRRLRACEGRRHGQRAPPVDTNERVEASQGRIASRRPISDSLVQLLLE
jgi:hypothetical protein